MPEVKPSPLAISVEMEAWIRRDVTQCKACNGTAIVECYRDASDSCMECQSKRILLLALDATRAALRQKEEQLNTKTVSVDVALEITNRAQELMKERDSLRAQLEETQITVALLSDQLEQLQKSGAWRVGGKVPLNVYEDDRPMFQCHTPEDAARVVAKLNQLERTKQQADINEQCARAYENKQLFCAHENRYTFTDDGGKTGFCTLCQLERTQRAYQEAMEAIKAYTGHSSRCVCQLCVMCTAYHASGSGEE